jgi:hypothetical protein
MYVPACGRQVPPLLELLELLVLLDELLELLVEVELLAPPSEPPHAVPEQMAPPHAATTSAHAVAEVATKTRSAFMVRRAL